MELLTKRTVVHRAMKEEEPEEEDREGEVQVINSPDYSENRY
jgi:hypothetical protein